MPMGVLATVTLHRIPDDRLVLCQIEVGPAVNMGVVVLPASQSSNLGLTHLRCISLVLV